MLAPTIICKIAKSSSRETISSLSRSYILNATKRLQLKKLIQFQNTETFDSIKLLTFKFFFATVKLIIFVCFDWPEVSQNLHKLQKVYSVIVTADEKGMNDSVTERIDGQLGNPQKIFPRQSATITSV